MHRFFTLLVFVTLASLALSRAGAQTSYTYRDIGTLGGAVSSQGVSNQGEVVGFSVPTGSSYYHAFYWSAATGMLDIGGGAESYARGINNAGEVVLRIQGASDAHAYLWNASTRALTDLNSVAYAAINFPANATITLTDAYAINDNHVVVGQARVAANGTTETDAVMLDLVQGVLTDLGVVGSGAGINNLASPQVVGVTTNNVGFFYDASTPATALPVQSPRSINNTGGVAAVVKSGSYLHPAYWSAATGVVDLGTFGGGSGQAYGVNDNGLLVGYTDAVAKGSSVHRAFRWFVGTSATAKQDLNSLTANLGKWVLIYAKAVNGNGQIACDAGTTTGAPQGAHVFLLTPQ